MQGRFASPDSSMDEKIDQTHPYSKSIRKQHMMAPNNQSCQDDDAYSIGKLVS